MWRSAPLLLPLPMHPHPPMNTPEPGSHPRSGGANIAPRMATCTALSVVRAGVAL
jgi:hypothetical protein